MDDDQEHNEVVSGEVHPEPLAAAETPTEPVITDVAWAAAFRRFIDNDVRNSPLAQYTEAWNHLHVVLPRLREHLEAELSHKE